MFPLDKPFHFLSLPKELRLMVYEALTQQTRHHTIASHPQSPGSTKCAHITLIIKSFPSVKILSTCRLIYAEALPVLVQKLNALRRENPKIIAHCWSLNQSLLLDILECITRTYLRIPAVLARDRDIRSFLLKARAHMNHICRQTKAENAQGRRIAFQPGACIEIAINTTPEARAFEDRHNRGIFEYDLWNILCQGTPDRAGRIWFRDALLDEDGEVEVKEYDGQWTVRRVERYNGYGRQGRWSHMTGVRCSYGTGPEIKRLEWEKQWVEIVD